MAGDDLRPLRADAEEVELPCADCGWWQCRCDEYGPSYLAEDYATWDEFAGVAW